MKNFKQVAFGLIVGAMAIGFSAFTSAHNSGMKIHRNAKGQIISVTSSFYNIDGNPANQVASNFVYRDGTTSADCRSAASTKECKADWTTDNMPSNGQSPTAAGSPSYLGNGTESAIYNGQ